MNPTNPQKPNFEDLTEVAGTEVSREQVQRMINRYHWAALHCRGQRILEVACGSGSGLGILLSAAASVTAGDFSGPLVRLAYQEFGREVGLLRFDGQRIPFEDQSFDAILLFEAIYYLPSAAAFIAECRRVLRPGGKLLLVSANKDIFDFVPSPHSYQYFGVPELASTLMAAGFRPSFFGDTPIGAVSARQRLLRPIKRLASRLGVVPRTMKGRKLLRRLMYGQLNPLPADLRTARLEPIPPNPLSPHVADRVHKVIYCLAERATPAM